MGKEKMQREVQHCQVRKNSHEEAVAIPPNEKKMYNKVMETIYEGHFKIALK